MFLKNTYSTLRIYCKKIITGTDNHQYLPFFRIAIGCIALADIITLASDFKLFFSENSTIIPQELTYLFSEYFNYLDPIYTLFRENNNLSIFYPLVFWFYITSLVALIVGFRSRLFALLALVLQLTIFKSFALFNFGYDHFLTMSLFYCFIIPVGKFYSLDNKIFRKKDGLKYNFNYQNMLRIHLAIVYLFAGLAKIISLTWWNGEAIWRSISSIYNDLFMIHPLILSLAGIITLVLEVGYPFLILNKKTQKAVLIGVVSMHLGIAFLLQLPLFAGIMIVWNITAYYDEIKAIIQQQ